jgi:hypothetical protein
MPRKHFAARSVQYSGRCKRGQNGAYVFWISRLNPVRNVRVVNGSFSSRYVVRGFGFCDLDSPDFSRRTLVILRAFIMRVVRMRCIAGRPHNTEAITSPLSATNVCQRRVELTLVLHLDVCRSFLRTSNLNRVGCDVWDVWKIAAADDHDGRDYRYYNQRD